MLEKACPILAAAGVIAQGASGGRAQLPERWADCIGQACAWYDTAREGCALLTAAKGK